MCDLERNDYEPTKETVQDKQTRNGNMDSSRLKIRSLEYLYKKVTSPVIHMICISFMYRERKRKDY